MCLTCSPFNWHYALGCWLATFHKYSYNYSGINSIGRLEQLCIPNHLIFIPHFVDLWCCCSFQMMMLSLIFVHRFAHSWNIVGQNWGFWTINVGKWHYKEWCIKYNNSLFVCKFSNDWKNNQLIAGKHICEQWCRFPVFQHSQWC